MALVGATKILAQAAPILLLAYFSKSATPDALGFLAFISALLSIISLLSDLGLSDAMGRFLHPEPGLLTPLVNLEILLTFGTGLVLLVSDWVHPWAGGHGPLLAATVASSAFYVLVAGLTGQGRLRLGGLFHGTTAVLFLVGAVLFSRWGMEPTPAMLTARLLSWGAGSAILLILFSLQKAYVLRPFRWTLPKTVLAFAISTFWFHAVELAINQIDVVLARALLGDAAAGDFKTASLLGMAPMAIGTLVSAALLPVLVRLHEREPRRARRMVATLTLALAAILTIGCLLGLFIAHPLLSWFYNPRIAEAGRGVFLFTLLATAFYVTGMPIQEWLLATDASRFVRLTATIRAVAFFPLAILLTRFWGITGMAVAHAAIYCLFLVTYLLYFMKSTPRTAP